MKYTENYQRETLNENLVVAAIKAILGGGVATTGADKIMSMAGDIGRNIRQNEYIRSGAKAGFGGSDLGTSDLISRSIMPNIQRTDFQRAFGDPRAFRR